MFDSVNKHQYFFSRGPGIEPDPVLGWEFLQETTHFPRTVQNKQTLPLGSKESFGWINPPEANTSPEKIDPLEKETLLLETIIFRCYVSFREGKGLKIPA